MLTRCCLALAVLLSSVDLRAQQPERPPELDIDAISARLNAVKEAPDLTDGERAAAVDSYSKALESVRGGDASSKKADAFVAARDSLPARLQDAKKRLEQSPPADVPSPPAGATLTDLEASAAGALDAQKRAEKELEAAEARIQARAQRQPMLPQLIAAARERLTAADAQLAGLTTPEQPTPSFDAHRIELLARRYAAAQELRELETELQSYEGSEELRTTDRDLAQRQLQNATETARAWQALVQARREADARAAEQAAAEAVAAAQNRHPLLSELAQENEVLAKRRSQLTEQLADVARLKERADKRGKDVEQDFQDVTTRVESMPVGDTLGALLRDRRTSLPDVRAIRKRLADTRVRRDALLIDRSEFEDSRRRLRDPENVARVIDAAEPPLEPAEAEALRDDVTRLLDARLQTVEQLKTESGRLLDLMLRLESAELALLQHVDRFVEFINEHVLWAPSTQPLWRENFDGERGGARWLTSPRNWAAVLAVLWQDVVDDWAIVGMLVVLLVLLFASKPRVHRTIAAHGEKAARGTMVDIMPTIWTLLLTLVAALPLPVTMWVLGWRLELGSNPTDFARAVAVGMLSGGWLLLALEFFRHVVRGDGLAEAHFAWPPTALRPFRRGLLWLTPTLVVGTIVLVMLEQSGDALWKEGLGRPVLLVMLVALAVFFWLVLHPRSGISSLSRRGAALDGWSSRLRLAWFVLGVGSPVLLFVLEVLGYHFTAVQLVLRLGSTVAVVAALLLANDVIVRVLLLERRRLALRQAAERRKAAAQKAEEAGSKPSIATVDEPQVDVSSIAEQTRNLVRSLLTLAVVLAVWLIWVDVLPALRVFKDVTLWEEITLADAMLSGIVFVMTFLAARNIPGVLHITLLQRLQVHEGERHAIATIARYVIILIGVIYGFSTLGLDWGKVQWLAAGISVGLGFGLQEVFANFISGLIILFERPIRVGDLVTVAGIDGYVTRIQMRATTIRDYNRKELVIPNKEFITGSVVNWTLTDAVVRLIVKVGVAYGSDTALAKQLLLRVAREEPDVLDKPRPKALFLAFGDSSLDFELRVFTANVDVWPEVIDNLHRRIDNAFRDAGIEIAFPQRDLHIRSAKPIVDAMRRGVRRDIVGKDDDDVVDAG